MRKTNKIISILLTVAMLMGTIGVFNLSSNHTIVYAADEEHTYTTAIEEYYYKYYGTPEAKLATMEKMIENNNYALYFDTQSAEVAYVNKNTGEALFSNPYDVAAGFGFNSYDSMNTAIKNALITNIGDAKATRYYLLSQLIVEYTDTLGNKYFLNSHADAALKANQINFKTIKDGVRVEYSLGELETKRLIPRWIEKSKYEDLILVNIPQGDPNGTDEEREQNFFYKKMAGTENVEGFYTLMDPNKYTNNLDDPTASALLNEMYNKYPVTKTGMAVYVLAEVGSANESSIERGIKTYCPDFTYETLQEIHEETQYEGLESEPALFKMALEYKLDGDNGFTVTLPANGIAYNETLYTLVSVKILPYFGAGTMKTISPIAYDREVTTLRTGGYTFVPDGSGTILDFVDDDGKPINGGISAVVYGEDYAYSTLSTNVKQQIMRMPVFGMVQNYQLATITPRPQGSKNQTTYETRSSGWFAIIEAGESLAKITAYNLKESATNGTHEYYAACATFSPNPTDKVNLGQSTSMGNDGQLNVSASRKYTGHYTIRYMMLTDSGIAAQKGVEDFYPTTYVGMAAAYRDYLLSSGDIEAESKEKSNDIPLYIESFGSISVDSTFLTFPTKEDEALTTFDDIKEMIDTLAENGITNVNFKLTGFANGGLYATVPYKLSFQKVCGGGDGFEELVAYAAERGIGIYPDFDFVYYHTGANFDGFDFDDHAAKSMDGRYTTKRFYDPIYQMVERRNKNYSVISSSVFSYFYDNFTEKYAEYGNTAISLSTFGSDLNSDFDKDEPYNREDSLAYTLEVLQKAKEQYSSIMLSAGNAYSLPYAEHVLDVPLDSSKYAIASAAVPFMGMALHGSVSFAGTPINMAGDIAYDLLKALENGASPYFILSYRNSSALKSDELFSKYYSLSFETWLKDLTDVYATLNDALGDCQDAFIDGHEFLTALQLPEEEASALFASYNAAREKYNTATIQLNIAISAVDNARKMMVGETESDMIALKAAEEEARTALDNARAEYNAIKKMLKNYSADDVVKVTYSNGKVFYLNYNSFDVAILSDDGVVMIGALDFKTTSTKGNLIDTIETYEIIKLAGVAGNNFTKAQNALAELLEGEYTQAELAKAELNLDKAYEAMLVNTAYVSTNCFKVIALNGNVYYFNLGDSDSVIRIENDGKYTYHVIKAYRYILIENEQEAEK